MSECSNGPLKYCRLVRLSEFGCATCQKWTNLLPFQFTDQRLGLKVSSGLHREQAAASGSEGKKVSYAAHITNWNCFIIKRFLLKIYLSIFLTCRPHWLNELELQRESEHLFYLHFSLLHYRLVPYRTEIQIFTSCFLSWLQQTCVSTGRQPPLQLPAQKWPIFIIDGVFLGYV